MSRKACLDFKKLTCWLQFLIDQGYGDRPSAEDVRQRMDLLWREMSEEEKDTARKFSAKEKPDQLKELDEDLS